MRKTHLALVIVGLTGVSNVLLADGHKGKIEGYYEASLAELLRASEVSDAVAQQNSAHSNLSEGDIAELDSQWKAEKKAGGGELMNSKLDNNLATYLRGIKENSGGKVVEIFVMDNKGLNVGQTDPTGDYMQGDEAKWQKTYPMGAGALFIDAVEEDGGKNISQTSATIVNGAGEALGAVTIGIDVDKL